MLQRFQLTLEITISKLLPAGVGWQAMAGAASNLGLSSTSGSFALLTGIGDGIGVGIGHLAYKTCQRAVVRSLNKRRAPESKLPEPSLPNELQTGLYLGSAAFCSGSVWQPTVNFLTDIVPTFSSITAGTGVVCAGVFFLGLRGGRWLYGSTGILPAVEPTSKQNLKSDVFLSVSIGGGSACFVGTDYTLLGNPLKGLIGIRPDDSVLLGCSRAGLSTAVGYFALQTGQNLVLPAGKNYLDSNAFAEPEVETRKEEHTENKEIQKAPEVVAITSSGSSVLPSTATA